MDRNVRKTAVDALPLWLVLIFAAMPFFVLVQHRFLHLWQKTVFAAVHLIFLYVGASVLLQWAYGLFIQRLDQGKFFSLVRNRYVTAACVGFTVIVAVLAYAAAFSYPEQLGMLSYAGIIPSLLLIARPVLVLGNRYLQIGRQITTLDMLSHYRVEKAVKERRICRLYFKTGKVWVISMKEKPMQELDDLLQKRLYLQENNNRGMANESEAQNY